MRTVFFFSTICFLLTFAGMLSAKKKQKFLIVNSIGVPIVDRHSDMLKELLSKGNEHRSVEVFQGAGSVEKIRKFLKSRLTSDAPDLVIANATLAAKTCHEVLKNFKIPMVFMTVADPVGAGLVSKVGGLTESFHTGLAFSVLRDTKIRLVSRIFKEKRLRVGMIASTYPSAVGDISLLKKSAKTAGTLQMTAELLPFEGKNEASFDLLIENSLIKARSLSQNVDYFWEVMGPLAETGKFSFAVMKLKPVIYGINPSSVKRGALLSINPNSEAMIKEIADISEQILKGTSPGRIPVTVPKKSDLTINLKTANALGLVIPFDVMKLAGDKIFR